MKEDVTFHTENSQRIYDLACDENMWKFWTDEEKSNFMRDPPLVNAINQGNWDIAKLKAIDRIVEYIHGYETDTLKRLLFYGFRSHEHGFRDGRSAESLWGKC